MWSQLFAGAVAVVAVYAVEPRKDASEYPLQAQTPNAKLGVEFTVQSVSALGQTFYADDFLTVEIGVYPAAGREVTVSLSDFSLRLNNKKEALLAQTPGMVAASIKYPDWQQRPRVVGQAGPMIIGQPYPAERFPNDPRATQGRLPAPPRTDQSVSSGVEKEPLDYNDLLMKAALPEGPTKKPVAGYLFFPYTGKLKSIKSAELVLHKLEPPLTIKLR